MNRVIFFAVLVLAASIGCNSHKGPWEDRDVFPVEGQLLIKGKAAEGVQLTFHPTDPEQQSRPHGVTDAEGKFSMRTNRDDDGAPAGDYVVTLYWPKLSGKKLADEPHAPPDRLGRRFLDPKKSSLRATVTEGPTVLPTIEIK